MAGYNKNDFPAPAVNDLVENKKKFVVVDLDSMGVGSTPKQVKVNIKNDMSIDYNAGRGKGNNGI